jgi:hypothetical protein
MAVTVVNPPTTGRAGPQEHGAYVQMGQRPHRWSLTMTADNDTFDTGLKGITETAITGTRALTYAGKDTLAFASADISIASISGSTITFSAAGAVTFDLLVWASE